MKLAVDPRAFAKVSNTHPKFLKYVKNVKQQSTGNAKLGMPAALLDPFTKAVDELDAAQTKAGSRVPADVNDRDAKAIVVHRLLGDVVHFVQGVADQQPTPADAEAIIRGAGLDVRKRTPRAKPDLAAKYTGFPGEARIVARAVEGAGAYFWEMSTDGGKTWVVAETKAPEVVLKGLTTAVLHDFRFRALTGDGKSDHSRTVSLLVH
jgi:hypothetical protein